ncbi:DUF4352 domain-containing protein [Leucobacter viscericola]|uniref:DUF4352 domain-containing protein n=1 Tax=Leucobacter viscericola TaxID=2714935 RepID=A0A6G7XGU7_9MICO|nr:DUF4352 domain-containing protein [Leucobacter viscericola]QIK63617.1 DUF4352 domain-containing protein [Leucobacter viscericola]
MSQQMPPEQPGQMPVSPQAPQQYAQQPAPPQVPAPEKKRSWFARHKVLTGLGGALVLIIIISVAASGGKGGSDEADAATTKTSETSTQDSAKTAEEPKKEDSKPAEKSKPGLGTAVKSGDFEFTAVSIEEIGATVGNQFMSETAQGRYVRVNVKVANVGDKPKYFFTNDLTIVDQKGRSFNADTTATLYDQSNADTFVAEINPGNAIEGGVVFDLPADVVATTLKVSGGGFSGSEEISLAG